MIRTMYDSRRRIGRLAQDDSRKNVDEWMIHAYFLRWRLLNLPSLTKRTLSLLSIYRFIIE